MEAECRWKLCVWHRGFNVGSLGSGVPAGIVESLESGVPVGWKRDVLVGGAF